MHFLKDDKNLVIMSVTLLGFAVVFSGPLTQEQVMLINSIFSGLFGVAIGKASKDV